MSIITEDFHCYKCTREGQTKATTRGGCLRIAYAIGWRENESGQVCSHCPGGGPSSENMKLEDAEKWEKKTEHVSWQLEVTVKEQGSDERFSAATGNECRE